MIKKLSERLSETAHNINQLKSLESAILSATDALIQSLRNGNRIFFCGNGGSAADSQHFAAEFAGRFLHERQALAAIALTVNSSVLTAISNDYGYQHVFSRQLDGLGQAGDTLVALSTSGNSENVIKAAQLAHHKGIVVIALTGHSGGELASVSDILINVPATRVDFIQEMHLVVGHILCECVEEAFLEKE